MSTVSAGLGVAALLVVTGGMAVASPQVTIAQVQKQLNKLTTRQDKLDQQLDQVKQELTSATQRLKVIKSEEVRQSRQFSAMRGEIGQIAAQAYEQGSLNSSIALLTSGRPQQILDQSSMLLELSSANTAEMNQFLAAARVLKNTQQAAARTRDGILQLKKSIASRLKALNATVAKEKALLAQLTPVQVKKVTAPGGGGGTGGGGGGGQKPPPVSGAAGAAVDYVFSKIGCPYLWGGTGPCNPGFDCSGLMMEAWASAGVSIPRVSYDQMSDLPAVSLSDLQPGDILGFADNSHVGMYVGGGYLIDAPQTGEDVEKVALSGWYKEELDGAVRP
jgi:peptidoglycan DL-endopeptidase CwlO